MSVDTAMMQAWVEFIKSYKSPVNDSEPKIEEIKDDVTTDKATSDDVTNLDNIEEADTAEITEEPNDTSEVEKPKPSDGFFNIIQAGQMIATHYNRQFPELKFVPPMNLVDGCVVDFMAGDDVIATAKMRFRNRIHLSSETGEMAMLVQLSDLAYSRGEVKISINSEQTTA
ncbi:hypothetical protein PV-S19_0105 [Pacmanvirus S19]|nr:hypothetical protein PV-S19_0105 [Pacmanvirus S19]